VINILKEFLLLAIVGLWPVVFSLVVLFFNLKAFEMFSSNPWPGRIPWKGLFNLFFFGGILISLACCSIQFGEIARGESTPFPWEVFQAGLNNHGIFGGLHSLSYNVVFLLWAFLIPAQVYAQNKVEQGKRRPIYPYVINILLGVIVSMKHNPFYWVLGLLS
jgi:hypothetical protein